MAASPIVDTYRIRTEEQLRAYLKASTNLVYFIQMMLSIPHPMRGMIPFVLYPYQVACLLRFIQDRFIVILKPRQMGMSTLVCAYVLWMALFRPHQNILIISIKQTVAMAMLRKIKAMYYSLPDFMKLLPESGSYDMIGTNLRISFSNGSQITVSAATEDAGRSEALTCLIMDEVAFQKAATMIWGAAQPTLSTGGQCIQLSTAYGVGNFFHNQYTNALQGLNNFVPIRLHWQMHPERDQAWYEQQSRDLGSLRLAQEIDCDFLSSQYNVFDLAKIKAIEEKLLTVKPIEVHENGRLKVFFKPEKGVSYVLGADVATGRSRDFSTFSIMTKKGKEVVCYKGKIAPRAFAHLMMKWGKKYNMAIIAPEINAVGEGPIAVLQDNYYPNIYHHLSTALKLDAFEREESLIMGWLTTGKTRHEMLSGLDEDLDNELVDIHNPYFVEEAYTFIYDQNNKPIALGKQLASRGKHSDFYDDDSNIVYNDDAIFGLGIANAVRKQPETWRQMAPVG